MCSVSYLSDDNSVVLPADIDANGYADAVVDLLGDEERLAQLRAAQFYPLDAMVPNCAGGVESARALRNGR